MAIATCQLDVNTTLPLVCICTLLSFLCGVGIGANDLSANFAMVVGSGSLNMRQAIIYCTVFELLGAAFMGGHVSDMIRNGIVDGALFAKNKDAVVIGMTCATFAAAAWLYLSTVFGLPVSITHTVVGSILGFAIFASGGFMYVKPSGLVVIVISWVAAPLAACAVTALLFHFMRRDIFKVKGRSFEQALKVLPYCLFSSLLVDYFFIMIERPPIITQSLAAYVPVPAQFVLLFLFILLFCWLATLFVFPQVTEAARQATSFVWESEALRTEPNVEEEAAATTHRAEEIKNLSFFKTKRDANHSSGSANNLAAAALLPSTSRAAPPNASTGTTPNMSPAPPPAAAPSVSAWEAHDPMAASSVSLEATAPSHDAQHPVSTGGVSGASFVMSSIVASDNPVVSKGRGVRLAPVRNSRTTSPLPRGGGPASSSSRSNFARVGSSTMSDVSYLPGHNVAATDQDEKEAQLLHNTSAGAYHYGSTNSTVTTSVLANYKRERGTEGGEEEGVYPHTPASVHSEDEFGEEDWAMDHPMQPIRFGGILIKPFNPRAEYLFTGLQVVAGSMSSFVHGAVAGANATATFVILYDTFTNHELETPGLSSRWSVLPAMLGIAIGMFGLGASLMKTVGMELVTVTPARGWCIQTGGTLVTMVLTGIGIPVSLSQSQIGAAIGCGVLDAKLGGVSWRVVTKVVTGWVVTLIISALTTGVAMWFVSALLCS